MGKGGGGSIFQIKEKCVTCQVLHGFFYIMEAGLGPAVSHFISLIPFESEDGLAIAGGESSKLEESSSCFWATMRAIKS